MRDATLLSWIVWCFFGLVVGSVLGGMIAWATSPLLGIRHVDTIVFAASWGLVCTMMLAILIGAMLDDERTGN
jgi:hypothetical protein